MSEIDVYLRDDPTNNGESGEFCAPPIAPENGRFICKAKNNDFKELVANAKEDIMESKTLAPGSICYAHCNNGYSIPYHLFPLSKIECVSGIWSLMDIDFCYKREPKRHHISHQSQN